MDEFKGINKTITELKLTEVVDKKEISDKEFIVKSLKDKNTSLENSNQDFIATIDLAEQNILELKCQLNK
jgi:hypothetical protein